MNQPASSGGRRLAPLKGRPQNRAASDTQLIQDPARLARLVKRLVTQAGSQRKAKPGLGIAQSLISRLANEELGELSGRNVARLLASIPATERKALGRALVTRATADLRRDYREWINEQRAVASQGTARRWFRTAHGLSDEQRERKKVGKSDRDRERRTLWRYARKLWPEMVIDIEKTLRMAPEHGHRHLALIRILDPLINASDTGFIEPSWREWRIDERGRQRLKRFLRRGIERERLLLEGRLKTSERALNVLTTALADFMSIYGESARALENHPNPFDLLATPARP